MRRPVIASHQEAEVERRQEKDIRKILKESDDRARKVFERRDPNHPNTCRDCPETPPDREDKDD